MTVEPKYNKDRRFMFSFYVSITKYDRNNLWRVRKVINNIQDEKQENSEKKLKKNLY